MSVKLNKTGVINGVIDIPNGHNLLYDTLGKYTAADPYVLTGTSNDIIESPGSKITLPTNLGNTFYLLAKCSPGWAASHGYSASTAGKATIWYYLAKTTGTAANYDDIAVCYTSSNWVKEGIWRTTIDVATYKSVSIRLNTYSDKTNSVTCKFWDIKLIPEAYFVDGNISGKSSIDIKTDNIVTPNIIEY